LPASNESKGVAGWKPALRSAPKEFFRSVLAKPNLKCGAGPITAPGIYETIMGEGKAKVNGFERS
jgi:hypothetical protein